MASRQATRTGDQTGRRSTRDIPLRALTALTLAVLSLPVSGTPASAGGNTFEIDGDLTGPRDWDNVTHVEAADPDPVDGLTRDDIFQASKEEGDPPTTWGLRDGSTETGGDITRVLSAHEVDADGDVWFYLGFFRADAGTGAFVVELNQLPNAANGMPNRSEGDVRIAFTQTSGNTQLTGLSADRWTGAAWSASNGLTGAHETATGQGGTFGELAINLTDAGLQPSCGEGFTAVNMRSRSSAQETASLKDYVKPLDVAIEARCQDIRVEKYDATTGLPLSGARFRLYEDDGTTVGTYDAGDSPVGNVVDADQGAAANAYIWSALDWGQYFVVETAMPTGYDADANLDAQGVKKVLLSAETPDGVAVVEFQNPQTKAQMKVSKVDAETDLPLGGASFRIFEDDGDGVFDADDAPVGPAQGADGGPGGNEYTSPQLAYGTYFVKETTVPAGYGMDPSANADGEAGTYDDNVKAVTLAPADAGIVKQVEFANPPLEPAIEVVKYDGTSGDPLGGAGFTLYVDNGSVPGELDAADTPVGGQATADQGPDGNRYTWASGLDFGTDYLVVESTVPAGYDADPTAGDDRGKPVSVDLDTPGLLSSVRFDNPRQTGQIRVDKWDWHDRDLGLTGARFAVHADTNCNGLLDNGDTLLESGTADQAPAPGSTLTNSYFSSELPWGCYLVEEEEAPSGYTADPQVPGGVYAVEIERADVGTVVTIDVYNLADQGTGPELNRIVVQKFDAELQELIDGATFELYLDANNDGVADAGELLDADPSNPATGVYEWAELEDGDYLVKEASPPAGYLAPEDDTLEVTVADGSTGTADFYNLPKKSALVVTKVDAVTQEAIDTAEFQLWLDANDDGVFDELLDDTVGEAQLTEGGEVSWGDLRMGTYFVQETVAPQGYVLPETRVLTLVVDTDNAGGTFLRTFEDPQVKTTIVALKKDQDTGEVLAGATFQAWTDVNQNGVVDEEDTPLGDPKSSNDNGVVTWTGLAFGHYLVEEVAPPAGYGLPEETTRSVVLDAENAGDPVTLVFLDPPLGAVSVAKVGLERNAAGDWVAADGEVGFGDEVKYVLTARSSGAKIHHDVEVSDFVPGFDPEDDASTADASYVAGSARCLGSRCPVSFDEDSQRLTWALGKLRRTERTMEFVVRMPSRPLDAEFVNSELIETVVNVATLSWQEQVSTPTARRAADLVARTIKSNEVVTSVVERPAVLPTPPAEVPDKEPPSGGLPDTGAPRDSGLITAVGAICVLLGAWLTLASRRRGFLPQR